MTKLESMIKDDEVLNESAMKLIYLIDEALENAYEMGYKAGKRDGSESKKKR